MESANQKSSQVSNNQYMMDCKKKLVEMWNEICNNGAYPIIYSFLTLSKDHGEFGVLSFPDDFVNKFGDTLPFMLGLKCNNTLWCVDYDTQRKEIYGLGKFMKFYRLEILNLVQLDYYGQGIFKFRIFRETTLECNYPLDRASDVECSKEWEELNRSHYVVDTDTIQFAKSKTSLLFNASSNITDYVAMMFEESNFDHSRGKMMLTPMWEELYKYWNNGSIVSIKYVDKSWRIKIKRKGEVCYLGRGWLQFVADVGLRDRDYLLAYKEESDEEDCIRVCICNADSNVLDLMSVIADTERVGWTKSFFKIVTKDMCERGMFVVPFLVNELYGWKLNQIRKISIGGYDQRFFYRLVPGCVYNLFDIMKKLSLREKDTILFTLDETDVLYGKVYQSDGSEVEYTVRLQHDHKDNIADCLWNLDSYCREEAAIDVEDDANDVQEFSTYLSSGNVDRKTHGLFIPATINPATGSWGRHQRIRFLTYRGVWNIGITVTGVKPRFSAGWNAFIRDNEYVAGQRLNFRMVERDDFFDFEITEI